jgi:hypothetical protein
VIVFTMLAEDFPATPCADAKLAAYDAAGRPVPVSS